MVLVIQYSLPLSIPYDIFLSMVNQKQFLPRNATLTHPPEAGHSSVLLNLARNGNLWVVAPWVSGYEAW